MTSPSAFPPPPLLVLPITSFPGVRVRRFFDLFRSFPFFRLAFQTLLFLGPFSLFLFVFLRASGSRQKTSCRPGRRPCNITSCDCLFLPLQTLVVFSNRSPRSRLAPGECPIPPSVGCVRFPVFSRIFPPMSFLSSRVTLETRPPTV